MAESAEKKNFFESIFGRIGKFFKGLKAELKRIQWPNRDDVFKQTGAVVVISLLLCVFIRLIDVLAQLAVNAMGTLIK